MLKDVHVERGYVSPIAVCTVYRNSAINTTTSMQPISWSSQQKETDVSKLEWISGARVYARTAGLFLFSFHTYCKVTANAAKWFYGRFYKNGSSINGSYAITCASRVWGVGAGNILVIPAFPIELSDGDYVEARVYANSSSYSYHGEASQMSGWLLREY